MGNGACYLLLDHKFSIALASGGFGSFDGIQDEQLDYADIFYVNNVITIDCHLAPTLEAWFKISVLVSVSVSANVFYYRYRQDRSSISAISTISAPYRPILLG